LSDKRIREDFAPSFEALDVLRPYQFWIAHNDPHNGLNDFEQSKRIRGIVFIWVAMVVTSAIPGIVGALTFHLVRGEMWWGWYFWTPLLFSAGSIGWGYLMRLAGVPQLLIHWNQPDLLYFHPFFLPFYFAFVGNEWAHHRWNRTHPDSALVKKGDRKIITTKDVWQMILSDLATQKFAKEGRLTINILTANFSVADGNSDIREALKGLVDEGLLRIIRVSGPVIYYGFVDAKKALLGGASTVTLRRH
jgi:hypothetical protein